ncbi:LamG-like jellyroll fold domain-containing protein [Patescibacteria group bacterium]
MVVVVHAQNYENDDPGDDANVTAVTFNSDSLTEQIEHDSYTSNRNYVTSIWTRVGPDVATGNVAVTFDATVQEVVISAMVFEGVDQATPVGATASNDNDGGSSTSLTVTGTTSYDRSVLVGGAMRRHNNSAAGPSYWLPVTSDNPTYQIYHEATQYEDDNNQEFTASGGFQYAESAGSHSMVTSVSTSSYFNGAFVELNEATSTTSCNTATTDFEVHFPDIVAGDNYAFMYYGNPAAESNESLLIDPSISPTFKDADENIDTADSSTYTFSYEVTSGDDQVLVVIPNAWVQQSGSDMIHVAYVTYDGVEMVRNERELHYTTNRNLSIEIFTLIDPPTGTNTVSITYNNPINPGVATPDNQLTSVLLYENVAQQYLTNNSNSAYASTGTSINTNVATDSDNNLVVGGGYRRHQTTAEDVSVDSPGTTRSQATSYETTENYMNIGTGDQTAAGADTHTFSVSTTTNNAQMWLLAATSLEPESTYDEFSPTSGPTTASEEVGPGPLGFWKFDEGVDNSCPGGTNDACDTTTNGNDAVKTGATWVDESMCVDGKCLSFDGVSDYVDAIPGTTGTDSFEVSNFTVSAWVRPTAAPDGEGRAIATTYDWNATPANLRGWTLGDSWGSVDHLQFFVYDSSGTAVTLTNTGFFADYDDTWVHVTGVFSDTDNSIKLYVNGEVVEEDTTSITPAYSSVAMPLRIGNRADVSTQGEWKGFIDEVKYYPYARSAAEVKTDYVKGASKTGSSATFGTGRYAFLTEGLTGYWPLDETAEGGCTGGVLDACDYSGNDNDGEWTGDGVSGASGKFGGSTSVAGSNDYVDMGDVLDLDDGEDMTLSAWVNWDTGSVQDAIISKSDSGAPEDDGYRLWVNSDNTLHFHIADGNYEFQVDTTATISTGTWHHIVVVVDEDNEDNFTIYIDGVDEKATTAGTLSNVLDVGTTNNLMFGIDPDMGNDFTGDIDEVRMYNRTLSPNEVSKLYAWGPAPVGHWPMDENTGTGTFTTYDKSGNGNNGTAGGSMTEADWVPGKFGSSLDFDGTDDHLVVTDNATLDTTQNMFTLEAWIYDNDVDDGSDDDRYFISKGNDGDSEDTPYRIKINNDKTIRLQLGDTVDSDDFDGTSTIPYQTWTHVAATFDGTNVSIYVNGVLDLGPTAKTVGTLNDAGDLTIGWKSAADSAEPYNSAFEGFIDDVRVYNYPRTASQVVEDMNAGHPLGGSPIASQVIHYKFDEANGTTINNQNATQSSLTGAVSGATWDIGSSCNAGACLDYDGTDDVTTVTNANAIDFDVGLNNGFTVSAWINTDTDGESSQGQIFNKGTNTWCRTDNESGSDLDVECSVDLATTDATLNISAPINTNAWHHVTVGYTDDSDDELTIWIDGVNMGSSANGVGSLATDANNLLIGGGTSNNFDGTIDDFKLYSTELTDAQVRIDYNAGATSNFGTGANEATNLVDGAGDAPKGWWKYDENTDGTCSGGTNDTCDSSGNGLDAAKTNMEEGDWVPGKHGSGLDFDGSNEYTVTGTSTVIDSILSGDDATVCMWAKTDDTAQDNQTFFSFYVDAGNDYLIYRNSSGTLAVWEHHNGPQSTDTTAALITDTDWHHLCWGIEGTSSYIYLDGKYEDTLVLDASLNDIVGNAVIYHGERRSTTGLGFDGILDDIRLYDYIRTPAQIAYDYNRGAPVGWWRLDECQGAVANDAGSGGNNGTITPSTGTDPDNDETGTCGSGNGDEMWNDGTTGKFGASLGFDGTNDYVTNTTEDGNFSFNEYSVSAWIYDTDGENERMIVDNRDANDDGWRLYLGNTDNLVCAYDAIDAASTVTISTSTWTHVACTADSDNIKTYINGIEVASASNTDDVISESTDMRIGARSHTSASLYFGGLIDDVRIYNYALSANQIKQVMAHGAVRFE